jgi:putative transposase
LEVAFSWLATFVAWYNDQHRHSGIRFVTPSQRHSNAFWQICHQRARVYEQARQRHPRRWS